jgi:hypothetical protein
MALRPDLQTYCGFGFGYGACGNASVYICKGSTPEEVVRFFNYLQFNPAVEWVELFALNGLLN